MLGPLELSGAETAVAPGPGAGKGRRPCLAELNLWKCSEEHFPSEGWGPPGAGDLAFTPSGRKSGSRPVQPSDLEKAPLHTPGVGGVDRIPAWGPFGSSPHSCSRELLPWGSRTERKGAWPTALRR